MPEFDAFGRKIEDGAETPNPVPASETGGMPAADSPASPVPESETHATPESPAEPPAPTGLKLSARPSRFSGGVNASGAWITVLVLVVVIGGGALVAWQAIDSANDAIRSFTPTLPKLPAFTVDTDTPNPTVPESPDPPEQQKPPPVGLAPRSLIRHATFAKAIDEIRKANLGQLTFVRVAPDRVDAQLVKNGRLRNVQVGYDGELRPIGGASGPGFSPPTIPFSAIDTGAPARLVRGGVRKGGVKSDGIDYLVVTKFGDDVIWNAYFKNSVRYQGDQSGRVERKF